MKKEEKKNKYMGKYNTLFSFRIFKNLFHQTLKYILILKNIFSPKEKILTVFNVVLSICKGKI